MVKLCLALLLIGSLATKNSERATTVLKQTEEFPVHMIALHVLLRNLHRKDLLYQEGYAAAVD